MKKYLLITHGYEEPTPEVMAEWGKFFATAADCTIDEGSPIGGGKKFAKDGSVSDVSPREGGACGYRIFEAENMEAAQKIASACPVIDHNVIYEMMDMGDCGK